MTAIATSELKQLELSDLGIDYKLGKSLARLLTQSKTLEELQLPWDYVMDCSVAILLDVARTHSNLKLFGAHFVCREVVHVYSLGDKVTLFPQFKYYYYYKHNRYYYERSWW